MKALMDTRLFQTVMGLLSLFDPWRVAPPHLVPAEHADDSALAACVPDPTVDGIIGRFIKDEPNTNLHSIANAFFRKREHEKLGVGADADILAFHGCVVRALRAMGLRNEQPITVLYLTGSGCLSINFYGPEEGPFVHYGRNELRIPMIKPLSFQVEHVIEAVTDAHGHGSTT